MGRYSLYARFSYRKHQNRTRIRGWFLALGIKNIYIGPSLPAFLSPNVLNIVVSKFDLHPITTPENDLQAILK
ncbi:hypothetical protein [Sporomusa rhizae]|uniref:hypothetical protein n=1 Tax=Sporomusa rhizae TaxID=357999 RepID=UPI00352A0071